MVGQVLKYVATYCLGFCSGVIYTSNKYGQNPNEIFNGWGESISTTATSAKNKCVEKVNELKNKKDSSTDDTSEVLTGEVE